MKSKKLLTVLLVLWGLPVLVIFGGAAWVGHAGMIVVDVNEHGRGGSRVHVSIPAAMIQVALPFIPDVVCEDSSAQMEKWAPVVRELCGELQRIDDGVLVEVTGGRENVQIRKKSRSLLIDVDSDRETVHVTMPLATVTQVLDKIQDMQAHKGGCRMRVKDASIKL